ncbi:class I SAM-dependent methyltransferase [Mycobacterium intracellulare]|uniref:Class I SAM-dependent methyltransferase n=1 Tax=Mycobacterium intracellulare TaxID=1767 RepID=A0AAE4RAX0_MYCIT|nr:class I SAM-dependent methyltransferase [Mycobacterium intracellulare]MCA2318042.1 class I SAM-dependent methyltransferase [Mycobacterium intracellulare]MCA2340460.1 class I SAM-dependent methyltransferase [Mycobacterium intracellulare]MDV6974648.1 class I SAM-dependent methyltransferase [Mycobacterium intracellulare]MDV6981229.1 class I SAM-dependent methyltransferase [Mycobacterium intracellulare]MDV7011627.1 class I SAM-dependent methyltransferase [Mycobacterium intracellulare]
MPEYAKHDDYWNHNSAYHPWLVGLAARRHGDVLDVGCGEGLLAQRLAAVSRSVVGIDADPISVWRAAQRLQPIGNASVEHARFEDLDEGERRYDLITFVASLHHLPLRDALHKARQMLRPAGQLAVVGLSANKSVTDWVWAGLCVPGARVGGLLHRETRDIGVPVADPREGLDEIRRVAADVLPGAAIRRGLYYRYRLLWRNR